MKIIENILTNNDCYKTHASIKLKGLMLHSVGVNQPKASVFVKNWNKSNVLKCVHAFVDANTGDVYQTLPWDIRGWHCGNSGNDTHIGVEMCEPDCIKYVSGSTFTCSDLAKAQEMVKRTYVNAVELFAYLCKEYSLNPLEKGVIVSHNEGAKMGIASNHGDPEHLWKQLNMNYTMDTFRQDVYNTMYPPKVVEPEIGSVITLKDDATYYNGKSIPSWVKKSTLYYRGKNSNGYLISILQTGAITGTVKPEAIIGAPATTPAPEPIKVGDEVKVVNNVTYAGKTFKVWYSSYEVIQISKDKVVIGKKGVVTCSININNIERI